jgi:hypothetical protein
MVDKFDIGDKVTLYNGAYDDVVYVVTGYVDKDFVFLKDGNNRTFVEHKESMALVEEK